MHKFLFVCIFFASFLLFLPLNGIFVSLNCILNIGEVGVLTKISIFFFFFSFEVAPNAKNYVSL